LGSFVGERGVLEGVDLGEELGDTEENGVERETRAWEEELKPIREVQLGRASMEIKAMQSESEAEQTGDGVEGT
jgi:hypothetical protein